MFEASRLPRVFGCPPGADFAKSLVAGLLERCSCDAPAALAQVEIYVNSARMQREIRKVFDAGPPRLLPRIRLVTDLANAPVGLSLPPAVPPLRRRLEIARFVAALLDQEPDLAPRAALFDLSDSLARLIEEMHGEGVSPQTICALDVTDASGHWERAQRFLQIVMPFFDAATAAPDKEARQRQVVAALTAAWAAEPPQHPIIVAGSTGSRGATAAFMQAVASLPQGALVLPGYDFCMTADAWAALDAPDSRSVGAEDHPQFRYRRLCDNLGLAPDAVKPWGIKTPPHPARNNLVSLALRPAPVTSQWLAEGPALGDLTQATEGLTLVEAPTPRAEADTGFICKAVSPILIARTVFRLPATGFCRGLTIFCRNAAHGSPARPTPKCTGISMPKTGCISRMAAQSIAVANRIALPCAIMMDICS